MHQSSENEIGQISNEGGNGDRLVSRRIVEETRRIEHPSEFVVQSRENECAFGTKMINSVWSLFERNLS